MENDQAKSQSAQAYPTYGLEDCIQVGTAVKESGGLKTPISKGLIASRLGLSADSSRLASLIGSARSFGILSGRGDYVLTDSAKRYFVPQNPNEQSIGLLEFLATPPPFEKLIRRFDGIQLPEAAFIANILESEAGVPKSWSPRVTSIFLQAATLAGAIDAGGFLRYEPAMHSRSLDSATEQLIKEAHESAQRSVAKEPVATAPRPVSTERNVWDFTLETKTIRLETPKDLTRPLWEKLEAYIKVIEPPKT